MNTSVITKGLFRIPLLGILSMFVISACLNKPLEPVEDGTPLGVVWKLNKNVEGLRCLADVCIQSDSIAVFSLNYKEDGCVLYWLSMKDYGDIELFSEIVSEEVLVPELSMDLVENAFYWKVNGAFLLDSSGNRIAVSDLAKPVSFLLHDGFICCRVKDSIVAEYPTTKTDDYLAKDVAIDYDVDRKAFNLNLSSGFKTAIPTISQFHLLDETVLCESFYKDVFLDAGIELNSRSTLPAADYLGLSLESMSFPLHNYTSKDKTFQTAIIAGDSKDLNGRLLYPDGRPRYRLLYVNGGNSTSHGQSLGDNGRENMRTFVKNGGSYLGICAGAFLASNGYDGRADYPGYLSIWPGMMNHTGLKDIRFGMFIEKESPLHRYYDFGEDSYVDSVYHSSGGYPVEFPLRTEILARYDYPKKGSVHRKPSIWAYKESSQSGRIVMSGSHPESYTSGERRDLTAAMMRYAMDGQGVVSLKGFLKNGEERIMDKKTTDNNPAFTRIGDLQTHHFAAYIPANARNIRAELNSPSDCDFVLMMNQVSNAPDGLKYQSSVPGSRQQLFLPSIREGIWLIAVQCLTTVTVTESEYATEYVGKTEVLNGVPYKISISWE
jgi:Uncharacterized conserved protein